MAVGVSDRLKVTCDKSLATHDTSFFKTKSARKFTKKCHKLGKKVPKNTEKCQKAGFYSNGATICTHRDIWIMPNSS